MKKLQFAAAYGAGDRYSFTLQGITNVTPADWWHAMNGSIRTEDGKWELLPIPLGELFDIKRITLDSISSRRKT
jgi:hypothetical protein